MRERLDHSGVMRPSGGAVPASDHRPLLASAPEVSSRFWGTVSFHYQAGRLVNVQVTESIKPEPEGR